MNENFYRQIVNMASFGYAYHKIILDENNLPIDYEFIETNDVFEKLTGLKRKDILNKTVTTVIPEIKNSEFDWITYYGNVAINGGVKDFKQYSEILDRHYHVKVYSPEKYYFVTIFTDISVEIQIANISERFIMQGGKKIDYHKISDDMLKLSGAKFVALNLYHENGVDYSTVAFSGNDSSIEKINNILGFSMRKRKWINNLFRIEKVKNNIVTYFDSIHDLIDDIIPHDIVEVLIERFNINQTVVVKINQAERSFGDFTLIMENESKINDVDIVEIYASQVGLFLKKKKIEEKLIESQKKYHDLAEQAPIGIMVCNREGKIEYVNSKVLHILDSPGLEETLKINLLKFPLLMEKGISDRLEICMRNKKNATCEINYTSKWGKTVWLRLHIKPQIDDGEVKGARIIVDDITESKLFQEKIEYISYHDKLTGVYNRRFFEEKLKKVDNKSNLPLSLVLLDVNGLKLVNDAFGHLKGDELLVKVTEAIKKECRYNDVVARIGGDEFVVILPKTNSEQVKIMVKRLNEHIESEEVCSINISVSLGWDTKNQMGEKILDIFKRAEEYMYRRKLFESTSMRYKTIELIMNTLYEKNAREQEHSKRVSQLSEEIGKALSLSSAEIKKIKTAGLMHDIGKTAIDEKILNKAGPLTVTEWMEIERHPEIGYRILSSVNEYAFLAKYILSHHERWDGNGYPKGLKGEEIPLVSRIISVADSYDAMTNDRPYRKALSKDIAIDELNKNIGKKYDGRIVNAFVEQVLGKVFKP